jgi:hypothetical protein
MDSISTHNKILETQIFQVAQQVASSSRSSGVFPGQPGPNPKCQMNVVTLRNDKQLVEYKGNGETNESGKKSEEPQSGKVGGESEKPSTPPSPPSYKPKISFPRRFARSKLD